MGADGFAPGSVTAGSALDDATAALIMVHGRNAGPANILDLLPRLARPAFFCVAPAAPGRTWYPYSFLAPRQDNEPGVSAGIVTLSEVVAALVARGLPRHRIVLLGFSQGACLASQFAVEHPARYGGLVLFSGGLIGPPGTVWDLPGEFGGTPVFLGCSDVDTHVPAERVRETAEVFTRMGAVVTRRLYPGMGHLVNDDEIHAAQEILDGVFR